MVEADAAIDFMSTCRHRASDDLVAPAIDVTQPINKEANSGFLPAERDKLVNIPAEIGSLAAPKGQVFDHTPAGIDALIQHMQRSDTWDDSVEDGSASNRGTLQTQAEIEESEAWEKANAGPEVQITPSQAADVVKLCLLMQLKGWNDYSRQENDDVSDRTYADIIDILEDGPDVAPDADAEFFEYVQRVVASIVLRLLEPRGSSALLNADGIIFAAEHAADIKANRPI